MNKKVLTAFVAVFILMEVLSFLMNGVIMGEAYQSLQNIWRPDMQRLWWVFQVLMLVGAFFFSFIFSKGYEGKGLMEGVRYGLYIGIWMGIGFAYGTYAMVAIPYSMALAWFVYTIVEYVLAGILAAAIFGKTAIVTAVKPVSQ
jgi:hypothetical protein